MFINEDWLRVWKVLRADVYSLCNIATVMVTVKVIHR